jgi:1,4-dihydroxy-2-naphthoate octaprenyltransferase
MDGGVPWTTMLAWLSLPIAYRAARVTLTEKGRPLNAALAGTGQAALAFSLLFWVGLFLQT